MDQEELDFFSQNYHTVFIKSLAVLASPKMPSSDPKSFKSVFYKFLKSFIFNGVLSIHKQLKISKGE